MTTFCIVAGTSPLLTGMLEPSGPVARGNFGLNGPIPGFPQTLFLPPKSSTGPGRTNDRGIDGWTPVSTAPRYRGWRPGSRVPRGRRIPVPHRPRWKPPALRPAARIWRAAPDECADSRRAGQEGAPGHENAPLQPRRRPQNQAQAPAFTRSANAAHVSAAKASTEPSGSLLSRTAITSGGVAYFDALAAVVARIARLAPGYGALPVHRSSATLAISSREAPLGRASLWRDL